MDSFIKLAFYSGIPRLLFPGLLAFILLVYSASAFSAWQPNFTRFTTPGGRNYYIAGLDRSLLASQYKTYKNLPTTSTFNGPVPVRATATATRGVPLPKKLLGSLGRVRAFSPAGLGFQAALIGGGYLLDYLIPDDPTSPAIDAHSEEAVVDTTLGHCENAYVYNSGQGWLNVSKTYSECQYLITTYGLLNYRWIDPQPTFIDVPITDLEIADTVFPPLSDVEFDDFINSPENRQPLIDSQPYQDMQTDLDSDTTAATDTADGVNPDFSTFPTEDLFLDTGVRSIQVPEYDNVPISNTDTTIDNTNDPELIITTHTDVDSSAPDGTVTTTVTRTTTEKDTGVVIDVNVTITTTAPPVNTPLPAPTAPPVPDVPEHNLCEEHPDSISCADFGNTLPPPTSISTDAVPFDFQVFQLASDNTCPQPYSFTLLLDSKTYSISYDPICQFATLIKPLILALGVYVAFTIVTQSVKSGGVA